VQFDHAIDLDALPLGHVFDPRIPWDAERRHMPGWSDAFNPVMFPSLNWRVVEEHHDGKRSIEFPYKRDGSLLCGQRDWADLTIEADVRQHHHATLPWFDDGTPSSPAPACSCATKTCGATTRSASRA
jgi:hypothetical protein